MWLTLRFNMHNRLCAWASASEKRGYVMGGAYLSNNLVAVADITRVLGV